MEKYTWVKFYEEFATKLLQYKNNRSELIQSLKDIKKLTMLNFTAIDYAVTEGDIDPFTVFSYFNRARINENKKINVLKEIKKVFEMETEVPIDFSGTATLPTYNANFIDDKTSDKSKTANDMWDLFEVAIEYADRGIGVDRLSQLFDEVSKVVNIGNKLTKALSWIRPNCYTPVDEKRNMIIQMDECLSDQVRKLFDKSLEIGSDGLVYLTLCEMVIPQFQKLGFNHYYQYFDAKWEPKIINHVDSGEEGCYEDIKIDETNYFWMNANPTYWSFDDIAVGEEQFYSHRNENGNKRRIYKNYLDAKPGDMIVGYEASPVKQLTTLLTVTKNEKEELYFKKLETLVTPLDYKTLHDDPLLKDGEMFRNSNGSLFRLTKEEYMHILDLIVETNPKKAEEQLETYTKEDFLEEVYITDEKYNRISRIIKKKKNIILQGAPGTGKTYCAKRLCWSLMGKKDNTRIKFVQFHQNYSYEDFVLGYKPKENTYELVNGIFYSFCKQAEGDSKNDYYFIIDEINRGNLSKIFGELLMCIENSYRNHKVTLGYAGKTFSVPSNLYIIGMMNTADRSLAMIDYALRRRFSFIKMEPGFDSKGFKEYQVKLNNDRFNALIQKIKELNYEIKNDSSLGEGFMLGHSYFCGMDDVSDEELEDIIEFEIIPMLEEYWFDQPGKVLRWSNSLRGVVQ